MRLNLLLATLLLLAFSCRKQSCLREFEFHFPATITAGDTFNIGDTLWMEMNLSNSLIDHRTGELIDLSEFDLYFDLSIEKNDTNYVNTAIEKFKLIEQVGSFTQRRYGRFIDVNLFFNRIDDKRFKFGIIPKKGGVYLLAINLPSIYFDLERANKEEDRLKVVASSCSFQDVTKYSGTQFNNGNINFHLVANSLCQTASPTDTLTVCAGDSTSLTDRGGYAFVVR